MELIWYGHSCFKIRVGDSVVLIDPFLTGNATFEASGIALADATSDVTHVALTHGHDDHVGDTVAICKDRNAKLIANFELAQYLAAKGVGEVDPMNPGGTIDQGDFAITMTPAAHSSSTIVDGVPVYLGEAGGLIITPKKASGPTVYHMGDTAIMANFDDIDALHDPQVGLVPIGDRFTMGAKEAAYACNAFFEFDVVIPCHYGTFPIIDQTPDAFLEEMENADTQVVVPAVGEVVPFEAADEDDSNDDGA